jgi:hypothetical protein
MALPKLDAPVYQLELPLSKKQIKFRPFLVKEQRNLMMAMETDDKDSIEKNIKQVLINCTQTENVDIDSLPILDVEYYFIQLRARSVGEIVKNKYRCENDVDGKPCNNSMETTLNLLEIKVESDESVSDEIQLTPSVTMKLKYPQFSVIEKTSGQTNATEMAFNMIIDSIDNIFDGDQFHYANQISRKELVDFVESLNTEQFAKIENFFNKLPKLNKKIECLCGACGFTHLIEVEGLENFFG